MFDRICSFPGCGRTVRALGLCNGHYHQQFRGKPLTALRTWHTVQGSWPSPRPDGLCSGPECTKRAKTRGLCSGHWRQIERGYELTPIKPRYRVVDGRRVCSSCGIEKDVEQFHRKLDGINSTCRQCRSVEIRSATYGMSQDEVADLLKRTRCEACGSPFRAERDKHIDHCHRTGRVRGLVCQKCNTALGCVDDSVDHLRQLIAYIERA